jgi:hypothetical protein
MSKSSKTAFLAFFCTLGLLTLSPAVAGPAARTNAALAVVIPNSTNLSKAQPAKKVAGYPFRGKLIAVNSTGGVISIGKSTYYITAETKLHKNGVVARLADFKVGESVVGYARRGADGRAMAASLRIGDKPAQSIPVRAK